MSNKYMLRNRHSFCGGSSGSNENGVAAAWASMNLFIVVIIVIIGCPGLNNGEWNTFDKF